MRHSAPVYTLVIAPHLVYAPFSAVKCLSRCTPPHVCAIQRRNVPESLHPTPCMCHSDLVCTLVAANHLEYVPFSAIKCLSYCTPPRVCAIQCRLVCKSLHPTSFNHHSALVCTLVIAPHLVYAPFSAVKCLSRCTPPRVCAIQRRIVPESLHPTPCMRHSAPSSA